MKNLFKNLMLVAVAAMAFTACTETNDEVNAVSKITRYEFTANIAEETRSGFAEKEEGATAYKSEWFGNETLKIFVTNYTTYNVETTAEINAEGQFDLELTDAPESFFMTVVSPAESWSSESSYTVPTEQTPLANSVDPAAHLLQAQAVPVSNGVADINMIHMAAYGKMTVNGVDFAIDHVVIDLKGSYYGSARELSYTINADNVDNNTFWFATEPIDVAEFTVTAYDAEGNSVAKTVDVPAEKNMSFKYGRVGTFSVSGLKEVEEVTYPVFTSASWSNPTSHDKLIKFYGDGGIYMALNFSYCNQDNFIDLGEYTIEPSASGPWKIYGTHGSWCQYNDADGNEYGMLGGKVNVSVVGGEYVIEFIDLQLVNLYLSPVGTLPYAKFTGKIENMIVPDNRTKLAKPTNVQVSVSGKTITTTWDPVEGADGYLFELYNPVEEAFTEIVKEGEGTSFSFTGLNSNWNYYFKLTAYASDENPNYRSSDEIFLEKRTEDIDPKIVLSKESISFTADGGNDAVDVTLKNIDGDFTYTVDADWLTVTRPDSGASLAVSAPVYENESEGRSAIITITAGGLSEEITVTQSKKGEDPNTLKIWKIEVGYDQPGEKEIRFYFNPASQSSCHVIDFKGSSNVVKEQPLAAGYYSTTDYTIDDDYCIYGYGTTAPGKPSFVDCTVTNNDDGTQTYEVRMTYNSVTYSWTYTGAYPA